MRAAVDITQPFCSVFYLEKLTVFYGREFYYGHFRDGKTESQRGKADTQKSFSGF